MYDNCRCFAETRTLAICLFAFEYSFSETHVHSIINVAGAPNAPSLGLDVRLIPTNVLLELKQLGSKLNLGLEEVLGIHLVL